MKQSLCYVLDVFRMIWNDYFGKKKKDIADIFQPTDLQLCDWLISSLLTML